MPKQTFRNLEQGKQERVMRAAILYFITHDFQDANIGRIARRAEVSKGSMYQYFEDMSQLFDVTVNWVFDFYSIYVLIERELDLTIRLSDLFGTMEQDMAL